ncbi:MAG: hypothetical protein A2W90_01380 [Bacteroidetes bacterium GWF2_42_66]|nr:MAG: hypothetical protein A2W92_00800 [Bacteroidetes bacterium GWA2_42_15]OFY01026.1 MAG: hypothetical protein A2W89_14870 [Bacteroidetes bacterium GWE2_42_39]OFY41867.1 MAG: hypothetical protein A2W90_01380 [Bacteroidetes bacterium GWF2_42_66]HBL77956.1 hypothetical protein [Prolixibacteraceae bacterium]HCR90177.1 hypothetical protein [Prolixibacteraceae bacterium]
MEALYNSDLFSYVLLPLMIFFARITDVTIGTIRIVMVSKGQKLVAPILGFFEVIIWLIAMSKIVQNIDNWVAYVAYGAGFATGNYIGLIIEERLAMGIVQLQIITRKSADVLIGKLKEAGYGITYLEAQGAVEQVGIIYSIIKRADIPTVIEIIRTYNPQAFYSIGDVKFVNKDIASPTPQLGGVMRRWRKGK